MIIQVYVLLIIVALFVIAFIFLAWKQIEDTFAWIEELPTRVIWGWCMIIVALDSVIAIIFKSKPDMGWVGLGLFLLVPVGSLELAWLMMRTQREREAKAAQQPSPDPNAPKPMTTEERLKKDIEELLQQNKR